MNEAKDYSVMRYSFREPDRREFYCKGALWGHYWDDRSQIMTLSEAMALRDLFHARPGNTYYYEVVHWPPHKLARLELRR